jgi:hypothetical protein
MTTYNLPAAAVSEALSLAPAIGTSTATTLDAANSATLSGALSAATLQTVFKFQTDSLDLTDVDTEFVADVSGSLFALETDKVVSASAVDSANQVDSNASNQTIEYDYVRHVAQQLLGHHSADIFSNESALRTSVTDHDDNWVSAIQTALTSSAQDCVDELMATLTSTEAGRDVLVGLNADSTSDGVATYKFPFASGDKLVIPVTFGSITGQAITNSSVTGDIAARTYNVEFEIVA